MAYRTRQVTLSATVPVLLWQTTGDTSVLAVNLANGIYLAGTNNDPLPILIEIPTGATLYICESTATSETGLGAIAGFQLLPLNIIAADSMYGLGTGVITMVVGRQDGP